MWPLDNTLRNQGRHQRFQMTIGACVLIYLVAQLLFLINIESPRGHNFDEFHYVPAAKALLEFKENRNWEHPPLGKYMMVVGIAAWGDRPLGWRFMSTAFGALTLVGVYLWALSLFRTQRIAWWVVGITLVNQLLYVQARIGMLDTFMFAFLAFALASFCASIDASGRLTSARAVKCLAASGFFFGAAIACKWSAIVPWAGCLGLVLLVKLLQYWGVTFESPSENDWYHPKFWKGISRGRLALYLVALPVVVYFLTCVPLLFVADARQGVFELLNMQLKMWDGQLRVVNTHPYVSTWLEWPLITRPIWYAFEKEGPKQEWVRGVLLLGNPLIMWSGLLALCACLWSWVASKNRAAFLICFFYFVFFASWIVVPRKVAFYYYYYPAGMTLGFALAYVFHYGGYARSARFNWPRYAFLAAAAGLFVYFFPILAALKIPAEAFRKWMWFARWI